MTREQEAALQYDANDAHMLKNGSYVRCAITNKPIALDNLRYWSVDKQEAYQGPEEVWTKYGFKK